MGSNYIAIFDAYGREPVWWHRESILNGLCMNQKNMAADTYYTEPEGRCGPVFENSHVSLILDNLLRL